MSLREFEYVQAIAKYQNITRAADSLYVGQPTLSKFLKNLEKELGVTLFRKAGHKYYLTYAGERYLEKAERILQMKTELDMEMADIVKRNVGVLRLGLPAMRCTYLLPQVLPAFQKLYPNVQIRITEGSSGNLDKKLENSEIDLAFYNQSHGVQNPLLETEVLAHEELLICMKKGHPLSRFAKPNPASRYPKLDVRLLQNEMVLMMTKDQRTRQAVDAYLKRENIVLNNTLQTSSIPAIMELISKGYGVGFMFEPHIKSHHFSEPVECFSFGEPKMLYAMVVASRAGGYLPTYAQDFIRLTKELYIALLEEEA